MKKMESSISRVVVGAVVAWVVIVCMGSSHAAPIYSSPQSQAEAEALRSSGCWSWESNISNHCHWSGVTCNEAGHVIKIMNLMSCHTAVPSGFSKWKFSSFPSLIHLDLSICGLTGSIPDQIGNLANLIYLDLSYNQLHGNIPYQLGALTKLTYLDLSYNALSGVIPSSLGYLIKLTSLNLVRNQINGFIPPEIGNLKDLVELSLGYNLLRGKIPHQLQNLKKLETLDLSYNRLSGSIPSFLGHGHKWKSIDLSHNGLKGHTPLESQDQSHHKIGRKITIVTFGISFFITLFLVALILGFLSLWRKKRRFHPSILFLGLKKRKIQSEAATTTKNGDLFSIWGYDGRIAYEDIIEATEDFDIKYCIGTGGHGSVYKVQLPSGKVVAVKKLHRVESEEPACMKNFQNEVHMLTKLRHKNIVKLHGYCLHQSCMFLICNYLERGSLYCMLRDEVEARELDWTKRVNVIKSIAHALSYMHHDCTPPIIHRDVSSNNILLNSELEAFVSDFGTARLLDPDSSNQTLRVGTYGYIAPGKMTNSLV